PGDPANRILQEDMTEAANADRLVSKYRHLLGYVVEWKEWIAWDGHRWARDTGGIAVQGMAVQVAKNLWGDIANASLRDMNLMANFAIKSNSARGISGMVSLARSQLAIKIGQLDTDPWLLNVANGTVDLHTGELRKHEQEDYLTKICPTPYDPAAKCPVWLRVLWEVFRKDKILISYLRRVLG